MIRFVLITALISFLSPQFNATAEVDLGKSQLIAAVLEIDGNFEIWINTRDNWNTRGSLVGSYTEEEQILIEQVTDKTNLCNLAESQYEPCRPGRTKAQIVTELTLAGVPIDPGFQQWAEDELKR